MGCPRHDLRSWSPGMVANSTRLFLSKLGFKSSHLKWLMNRISRTTMRSSYLIWCCRKEKSREPPELVPLREPTTALHDDCPVNHYRKGALTLLASISCSNNPGPNLDAPPGRRPSSRPPPSESKYDYETLAEEAEVFDDHWPSSPFEPDGPDAAFEPPEMLGNRDCVRKMRSCSLTDM